MLEVSCRDLGSMECDFVAAAASLKKLQNKVLAHARDEHPELIAGITMEQHRTLETRIADAAHQTTNA